MISLRKVEVSQRELLWNINQKYLYEMTNFYADEMDENGNYHYGYFDAYFTEPERIAFFIYDEETMVGFAMINPYSYLGQEVDYVLAEFTVFPSYRHRHIALIAAQLIFNQFHGAWEIKFNEHNIGAKKLWEASTKQYNPIAHHLNADETVLEFRNK